MKVMMSLRIKVFDGDNDDCYGEEGNNDIADEDEDSNANHR